MQNSTDSKNASKYDFLLQNCVDALARGECTDDEFLWETLGHGAWEPDSAWEVLSVIDQRYRRGELPHSVFASIKARIARRMPRENWRDEPTNEDRRDAAPRDWRDEPTIEDRRDAAPRDWRDEPTNEDRRDAAPRDWRDEPTNEDRRDAPIDDQRDAPAIEDWRDAATIELFPPAVAAIAAQLASPPALVPAPTAARNPEPPADPRTVHVGRVLRHRYVVESLLGSGGMGDVYKASAGLGALRAESPTPVAVKVLRDRIDQRPDLMQRLQREFDCTRSLSHPNIVKVYEFERNGQFAFYTMELLEGEHLGALLGRAQDHPLPQTYAWSIVGAMGAALAHAHSRNVVHGDVSPKNVMITRDGEVRVLDFGSSSLGQGLAAAATAMADSFAATPAYASCEVLEGQKPEPRDDLYALACLAYELLAGEHPFRGKRSTEARDLGRTPRRPPGVNFMRWRTLQRGLAWTRAERSMSVREWLGNLGLEPQPERLPTLLPDSEPPPFYRVPLARGMALGIAVLAGAAVAWYSYTNSPEAISPGAVSPDLAVPTGSLPVTAGTAPPRVHDVSARYIAKPEALPREAVPPDALSLAAASPMAASPMAASPMVASPMAASPEAAQSQFTPPLIASSEAAPRDRVQLPAAARQATPTQAALRETQLQIAPPLASPPLASPPLASPPLASPPLASAAPPMVAASEAAPRDAVQLPDAARQATSTPAALREPQLQIAPLVAAERGPAPAQAAPRGTAPPQPAQAAPQGTAPPQPAQAAPQGTAPPQPAQAAPRGAAPPQPATAQASGSMATPLVASQEAAPRKSAPRRATLTARAAARSRNARARSMTASAHSMNPKARAMIAKARSKAPKARSTIQFTDHRYAVPPSARFVETHVRRSRASGDSTKFVWWTDDSTAKSGVDFVAQTPTPYVFSSGRQFASLFIRLVPNPARTQEANFHVCLGKPGSGSALTDVTCSAILLPAADTDPPS